MLDKYTLVPYEKDLASLADATPFDFEAMQLQLDTEAANLLLEGIQDLQLCTSSTSIPFYRRFCCQYR